MKALRTTPGAKRLMESLRNMGYDLSTAIADLVDNSITAQASEIHIDILPGQNNNPASIVISDNGKGMNREQLREAMRFGSFQEYSNGNLGKYGLGLKTASLSQCRCLTVATKSNSTWGGRRFCMRWDIDHVYKIDDWELLEMTEDELSLWERNILYNNEVSKSSGTVILWTKLEEVLPLLTDEDDGNRERFLSHLMDEVNSHLRMVFHRFMQGSVTGYRKLSIYVCGEKLEPWDPFCRNEKTKELPVLSLPLIETCPDGSKIKATVNISPFILPRDDEFTTLTAWKDASGPKNWNQQQGLYFYRNNRLLQAGGWNRLRSSDEHTKLLRVAVDFTDELDQSFAINITKMKAKLPATIRQEVAKSITEWVKQAQVRYRRIEEKKTFTQKLMQIIPNKKEVSMPKLEDEKINEGLSVVNYGSIALGRSENDKISVSIDNVSGKVNILVPNYGNFAKVFSSGNIEKLDIGSLCQISISVLESITDGSLDPEKVPLKELKALYRSSS